LVNTAYKQKDGFTAQSSSRYFTPDAVMRVNGKERCRGLDDLAQHFRDIQQKPRWWSSICLSSMNLPRRTAIEFSRITRPRP